MAQDTWLSMVRTALSHGRQKNVQSRFAPARNLHGKHTSQASPCLKEKLQEWLINANQSENNSTTWNKELTPSCPNFLPAPPPLQEFLMREALPPCEQLKPALPPVAWQWRLPSQS
eukprot:1145251-Pelagomonas_calceolata.AAC.6